MNGAEASIKGYSKSLGVLTAAQKAAALGQKLLNSALNMGITMLVSWGISELIKAFDAEIHATENAIAAGKNVSIGAS